MLGPGIYEIPDEEYHRDPCVEPSLSSGVARLLLTRSPRHAFLAHPRLSPAGFEAPTNRMDLGSAAHAALCGGGLGMVAFIDAEDWRTKAAKEKRDAARKEGRIPILAKFSDALKEMVWTAEDKLERCALTRGALSHGLCERTVVSTYEGASGQRRWLRCKPDIMTPDLSVLIDYKTTGDAEPSDFQRTIVGMGYDVQAAHYLDTVNRWQNCAGTFVFLVQETDYPFSCSLVGVGPTMLELGEMKAERARRMWDACLTTGKWRAFPDDVAWAEAPGYAGPKWLDREQIIDQLEAE